MTVKYVSISGYFFPCLSLRTYTVQPVWMDLGKDPKTQPGYTLPYRLFMGRPRHMVWLRLLPVHPLALAGAQGTRLFRYAQFLY